jgi:D-3-phosphoglycerate dehydrogenase
MKVLSTIDWTPPETKKLFKKYNIDLIEINPNEVFSNDWDHIKDVDAILAGTEKYNKYFIDKFDNLRIISRHGVGTDNIDLKYCKEKNIYVFNTPQIYANSVAEYTLGLILNLLRRINEMDGTNKPLMGEDLRGKTVCIIGMGAIGTRVMQLLKAFGCICYLYDKKYGHTKKNLHILLPKSAIVTLHIPYTGDQILGTKELNLMKNGSYLINTSRGGLIDEDELYNILKYNSSKISGAAIDTFKTEPYNGPLKELKNCICLPHAASYARKTWIKMANEAAMNIIRRIYDV